MRPVVSLSSITLRGNSEKRSREKASSARGSSPCLCRRTCGASVEQGRFPQGQHQSPVGQTFRLRGLWLPRRQRCIEIDSNVPRRYMTTRLLTDLARSMSLRSTPMRSSRAVAGMARTASSRATRFLGTSQILAHCPFRRRSTSCAASDCSRAMNLDKRTAAEGRLGEVVGLARTAPTRRKHALAFLRANAMPNQAAVA